MPDLNIWFYAMDGQRHGPMPEHELKSLIASGQISPDDLVWQAGMADWAPASSVPELSQQTSPAPRENSFAPAVSPSPVAQPTGSPQPTVSYYRAAIHNLPPRAAETLRGHAPPSGDIGFWPLDDAAVQQFVDALKRRKSIIRAARLYHALLLLTIIGGAIMGFGAAVGIATSRNSAPVGAIAAVSGFTLVLVAGFAALYYFAHRATIRSWRWATLTMTIIFSLLAVLNVLVIGVAAAGSSRNMGEEILGQIIMLIFVASFAIVSLLAFVATPKYLASPAWCQELLARTKL